MKFKLTLAALVLAVCTIAVADEKDVSDFASDTNCRLLNVVVATRSIEGLPEIFVTKMDDAMDAIWQRGERAATVASRLQNICAMKFMGLGE